MDDASTALRTLTLALLASALLAGAQPTAAEEPPAPPAPAAAAAPGGTVYNIEIIVFRAVAALGAAENWSAEAGARSIADDEGASASAFIDDLVAQHADALDFHFDEIARLQARRRRGAVGEHFIDAGRGLLLAVEHRNAGKNHDRQQEIGHRAGDEVQN